MQLGERIRAVRECEHLGRHAFSEKTGINKQTLINIETGKAKKFSALELEKVGTAFPDYAAFLITGNENEEIRKKLKDNLYYRK